jgi:glycosyltransferase involved in cell wall biosynthesis
MLHLLYLLSFIYFGIIFTFAIGVLFLKKGKNKQIHSISIIIAARNEEKYLPILLEQIANQNYPPGKYEIIVADDRSTDQTSEIIREFQDKYSNIKAIRIEKENIKLVGKKGALDAAIKAAKYEILAFTDADCLPSENWLQEINKHFSEETDFVAGYSPLINSSKFLLMLKNLERASIFAVTAGGFAWNWGVTCTARNMAYSKSIFNKVNGFEGIGHLKSGDDDLMLQKMNRHIRKMNFMFTSDSVVFSHDKENLSEHADLESRRASKWKYYPFSIQLMTLFILLFYSVFIFSLICTIVGTLQLSSFFNLFLIKTIPEFLLLFFFLIRIKKIKLLWVFPLAELIYLPYFIFFALKGTFGKFKWKE